MEQTSLDGGGRLKGPVEHNISAFPGTQRLEAGGCLFPTAVRTAADTVTGWSRNQESM